MGTKHFVGYGADLALVLLPSLAVAGGHLSHVYLPSPTGHTSFQPPGYPMLAGGLLFVLGHLGVSIRNAINLSSVASVASLVAGGVILLRTIKLTLRWQTLFLVGLVVDPLVAQTMWRFFHPQDVFSLGLVLVGVASGVNRRWVLAGILIGVAIAFKQTAVLALIPLVVAAPVGQRLRFLASTVFAATAAFAPLVLTNLAQSRQIVEGPPPISATDTILAHVPLSTSMANATARAGPLVAAVAITAVLYVVGRRRYVSPTALIGVVFACLSVRTIFEAASFAYYLLPASVGVLLVAICRRQVLFAGLWFVVAAWWFDSHLPDDFGSWPPAIVYFLLSLSAVAMCMAPLLRGEGQHPRPWGHRLLKRITLRTAMRVRL